MTGARSLRWLYIVFLATTAQAQHRVEGAVRGVWIPTPEHTRFFDDTMTMSRELELWRSLGINTVFVAVWNQGRTMYPSTVMKRLTGVRVHPAMVNRDPLGEVIAIAHRLDIKVYAWFEYGFASDYRGGPGSEILRKNTGWAALDLHGAPIEKNGFHWMNALDPDVQDFLLSLILEVAATHDLDGVQGDDRLPALPSEGGYNPATVARYRAEHGGAEPPADSHDSAWVSWRSAQLDDFMHRLHDRVKALKPSLQISMAPGAYPFSRTEYLQDWPGWLHRGWVDHVSPQLYRRDIVAYERELRRVTREQLRPEELSKLFPGILLSLSAGYLAEPELVRRMVEANRRAGIAGELFFFADGVTALRTTFEGLYKP